MFEFSTVVQLHSSSKFYSKSTLIWTEAAETSEPKVLRIRSITVAGCPSSDRDISQSRRVDEAVGIVVPITRMSHTTFPVLSVAFVKLTDQEYNRRRCNLLKVTSG